MLRFTTAAAACVLLLAAEPARADCGIAGPGEVDVITNFFETFELMAEVMKECRTDDFKVDVKLTTESKAEVPRAFEAARSPIDAAAVANASITPLQAKGQLLPLNALVDKYRAKYALEDNMLIRFGDDIMAIAFMVNAQHLFYRKDIFEKHKLSVPKTYDELLAAAEVLEKDDEIQRPFGAAFGNSWELANEFVNIHIAMGGQLFDPATSEPAFAGKEGLASLELMGKLIKHMSPNALALDFGDVKRQLQQSQVGMAILWGDQAPTMDDAKESRVVGKVGFAVAPTVIPGGHPASLFWWDGYVIPKNADGDPDKTFQVIMHAVRPEVVAAHNETTLWLRSNYEPTQYAAAITETVMAGVPPYPMDPQAELAHAAIGENIGDFLSGKESAQQSLQDAVRSYRAAAINAGVLAK